MADESTNGIAGHMPIGNRVGEPIRADQVTLTEGNIEPPAFSDDAAATLVWGDYQQAKNYVENWSWLLEWQHADVLYQSPTLDRYPRAESGRPPRVSRFLVAKNCNTMSRQVKRALFAEQIPFLLRPTGHTTQLEVDAWTAILQELLKRMKFEYFSGLVIDCQTLQGTGLAKWGVEQKEVKVTTRRRKKPPVRVQMPVSGPQEIPTEESDEFECVESIQRQTWPWIEYRRLGTTLFDPKCSTPNHPEESAAYTIDIDYVTLADLQEMRQLDCYENIPDDETLKAYFLENPSGSAPPGSQVEQTFDAMGSAVTHAEGRYMQKSADPFEKPLMLLERWTDRDVKTLLCYDGRYLLIRNEEHGLGCDPHGSCNWWSIDNCLYGMGIGRLNGPDQRINQGVTNEALKMLAYPMNAPVLVARGENAPTQNIIQRMGGFIQVDVPPGGDVRKGMAYMEMPPIPPDAWKMIMMSQQDSEDVSGANGTFMQGNLGGPGSSAARTATGASRIASKADDTIAGPVDAFAGGILTRVIYFLIHIVKEKMPVSEIREILGKAQAKIVLTAIEEEQFLNAEFEIAVLAGQKLQAKQGIQQLVPFLLQLIAQPQILQYYHQIGKTIDFGVIIDLFIQISELQQQPDIIRDLTAKEMQTQMQTNPVAQQVQGKAAIEQARSQGKIQEIRTQGQVDLANKSTEIALEHSLGGMESPLMRAENLLERGSDEKTLQGAV